MKKLYRILNTFLWCIIGVFLGDSIYRFYDYKTNPGLYELQSAPWYKAIVVQGIFTAVIVMAILIVMLFLKKKMGK